MGDFYHFSIIFIPFTFGTIILFENCFTHRLALRLHSWERIWPFWVAPTHPKLELVKRELGNWKGGEWMWGAGQKLGFGILCRAALGWWGGRKEPGWSSLWGSEITSFSGGRKVGVFCLGPLSSNVGLLCVWQKSSYPGHWGTREEVTSRCQRKQPVKAHCGSEALGAPEWQSPGEMWAGFLTIRSPSPGPRGHQLWTHRE